MPDPGPELSGGPVTIGLYGKMPAHGDFVRRALPGSFIVPWDAWLAAGITAARDRLGDGFAAVWDVAPAWRFALPAGTCGPDAVAGVMLPSADTVGRRFPLTVATLLRRGEAPGEAWFADVEARVREAREGSLDADALTRALMEPGRAGAPPPAPPVAEETLLSLFGAPAAVKEEPSPTEAVGADGGWLGLLGEGEKPAPDATAAPAMDDMAVDDTVRAHTWQALLGGTQAADAGKDAEGDHALPVEVWLDEPGGRNGGATEPASGDHAEPPPAAWLDLLGPQDAVPEPAAQDNAAADAAWQELLDVPAEDPVDESRFDALLDGPAPPADRLPSSSAEASPAADASSPADPVDPPAESDAIPVVDGSAGTDTDIVAVPPAEVQTDAAAPPADPAADAAFVAEEGDPLPPPPERPEHGGWWTLGGGRLPAMVWAFPALPPPEAFVLLLETEA